MQSFSHVFQAEEYSIYQLLQLSIYQNTAIQYLGPIRSLRLDFRAIKSLEIADRHKKAKKI